MRNARVTLLALLALLVPVAGASAARVPPGNSGATQYAETMPGAGGEEGTGQEGTREEGAGGKEGGTKSTVPTKTAEEFEALGAEGEAVLKLARSSGAPAVTEKGGKDGEGKKKTPEGDGKGQEGGAPGAGGPSGSGPSGGLGASSGSSGVGSVLSGAVGTSGGGLGFLQPLILATILIAAGAFVLRRRTNRPA